MSPSPQARSSLVREGTVTAHGMAGTGGVPRQSKLLKICPPERGGNLLSRMRGQTGHGDVSHWSHSTMQLPKVGAGVSQAAGAADHHTLRSLLVSTPEPGKRSPLFPIMCLQCPQLTKLNVFRLSRENI